jgi:hypothetical protein
LSVLEVWPALSPDRKTLLRWHADHDEALKGIQADESNFRVGSSELTLAGRTQVESGSERDIFSSFPICEDGPYRSLDLQTISLLLVMIEFSRWKDVLDIVSL